MIGAEAEVWVPSCGALPAEGVEPNFCRGGTWKFKGKSPSDGVVTGVTMQCTGPWADVLGDSVILESGGKQGPLEFGREGLLELVEQPLTNDTEPVSSWLVDGRDKDPPMLEGLSEVVEISLI